VLQEPQIRGGTTYLFGNDLFGYDLFGQWANFNTKSMAGLINNTLGRVIYSRKTSQKTSNCG